MASLYRHDLARLLSDWTVRGVVDAHDLADEMRREPDAGIVAEYENERRWWHATVDDLIAQHRPMGA